jgi:hypothetical protein
VARPAREFVYPAIMALNITAPPIATPERSLLCWNVKQSERVRRKINTTKTKGIHHIYFLVPFFLH